MLSNLKSSFKKNDSPILMLLMTTSGSFVQKGWTTMGELVVINPGDLYKELGQKKEATIVDSHPHQLGLYNNKQRILIVGDGNLSFSLCLASVLVNSTIYS